MCDHPRTPLTASPQHDEQFTTTRRGDLLQAAQAPKTGEYNIFRISHSIAVNAIHRKWIVTSRDDGNVNRRRSFFSFLIIICPCSREKNRKINKKGKLYHNLGFHEIDFCFLASTPKTTVQWTLTLTATLSHVFDENSENVRPLLSSVYIYTTLEIFGIFRCF